MKINRNTLICMLTAALLLGPFQTPFLAQEEPKPVLSSLDELPPRTYTLPGTIGELLASPEKLRAFAAVLREDLVSDLAHFDFASPDVERKFYSRLLQADLALKRLDDARHDIKAMRRLSDTEALKCMAALHAEAWVRAREATGPNVAFEELHEIYAKLLREAVNALPWESVRQELTLRRFKIQVASEKMLRSMLSSIESRVSEDGVIDAALAHALLGICNSFEIILPIKDVTVEIYSDFLRKGKKTGAPIMTERQITLKKSDGGQPVVIAIWDTGVDVRVFPDQLFVNPRERTDGRDTDGNGYVDDLHGIAFGDGMEHATELLKPHDLDGAALERAQKLLKGWEDGQTGDQTPESAEYQKLWATLKDDGKRELKKMIKFYDFYCHGTHVTGIAAAGNPFARILVARLAVDEDALKTEEWARGFVAMCRETVACFKANGVRVANMSWGWDVHEIEDNLDTHGVGADAGERAAMAGKIFGILEKGLYEALAGAPKILFVNGAGKAPGDRAGYRWIPGIYDLPNVIPVGAVDAFGEPTPFTTHGPHVRLLADGFHVDSFVPGGKRIKLSGTSMAAPQVTNLAAKLIALKPSLTPKELIALMIEGGETVELGGRPHILLNPQRSLELLRAR